MNINEIVNNLNNPRLKNEILNMAKTPKGQEVLKKLQTMDTRQISKYINNINNSNISSELLIQYLRNNPNILDQINKYLSK